MFHIEYDGIDAGHLLEEHATDADRQSPSVHVPLEHFTRRVTVLLLFFDEFLPVFVTHNNRHINNELIFGERLRSSELSTQ